MTRDDCEEPVSLRGAVALKLDQHRRSTCDRRRNRGTMQVGFGNVIAIGVDAHVVEVLLGGERAERKCSHIATTYERYNMYT